MVRFCEECEEIIDEIYVRSGHVKCRRCVKKERDAVYYQRHKRRLKRQARDNREEKKEQKDKEKERKAKNAESARRYRERIKEGQEVARSRNPVSSIVNL